jgi:regulator of sirC expression with transglutaminase-like and TPR domain
MTAMRLLPLLLLWLLLPPAELQAKSVEEIAAEVKASVVKIMQVGRDGIDGIGTGFVVGSDGLIATNLHVIGEARRLEVETSDGTRHEVAEVTATDAHWDLALLRVGSRLKPLPLGDSERIRQGQPVVAMGNPQGLAFSVVDGVVSEYPDLIDDIPMIRLALPIEKGNSGGPLLDRDGRVLGILTLKSARTENLGFAMPVNELKRMIDSPNPVLMDRWLTIGVLNPKLWQPLMGARWTQHAGVIQADTPGAGFGGRSLCLWQDEVPPAVFEVSVEVKLDDESGAAGLAFCADGGDRHYGFYPSAGKLRVTRFEGGDVYAWTILADVPSEVYRPGEWNHLRVRVEAGALHCWVNGRLLLTQEDAGLRGGRAGLCKFRNTLAQFRRFRLGPDLSEKPLPELLAKELRSALDELAEGRVDREPTLDRLLADPETSRRLMTERRTELERQATELRDLERELHRLSITRELLAELAKPEAKIDLMRAALLLARHDNVEVEVDHYLQAMARMVEDLRDDPALKRGTASAVARIRQYLFDQGGFHGSRHDYQSRSNSYMNEVLDDREGLPITLSVLFVELAARLGVKEVFGVPLPGQFMVGYKDAPAGELKLVDVFERGRELTVEQAALRLTESGRFDEEVLRPAGKRSIILRMVRNLLGLTLDDQTEARESLPYLNLVLALDPEAAVERLTRARLHQRLGDKETAAADVRWLTEHFPEQGPEQLRQQLEQWLESLQ